MCHVNSLRRDQMEEFGSWPRARQDAFVRLLEAEQMPSRDTRVQAFFDRFLKAVNAEAPAPVNEG